MFFINKKLSPDLKKAINKKLFKSYRVIIHCKNLIELIEKKIKSYKGNIIRVIPSVNCISAELSPRAIERLMEQPSVDYITFDEFLTVCGTSILASNGVVLSDSPKYTGRNVCVGIIDSGIYPHPDLLKPSNKIKGFIDILNDKKYPYDDNGHGTFMSGIICGSGYCSKGLYKGVAKDSSVFMIKAFNSNGRGYVSDLLYSIELLINLKEENKIKIILIPCELFSYNSFIINLFDVIFKKCKKSEILVVVPSGNNGNNEGSITGFATLDSCLTIGGVDTNGVIKPYINSSGGFAGKTCKPEFAAAAVDLCSLSADTSYISEKNSIKLYPKKFEKHYVYFHGTSCASAFIAGIASMLYEKNPEYTTDDIISTLKLGSKAIDLPKHIVGSGVIDFKKLFE